MTIEIYDEIEESEKARPKETLCFKRTINF
jgi:hypothetical protein